MMAKYIFNFGGFLNAEKVSHYIFYLNGAAGGA
jgi:hypothetical protein